MLTHQSCQASRLMGLSTGTWGHHVIFHTQVRLAIFHTCSHVIFWPDRAGWKGKTESDLNVEIMWADLTGQLQSDYFLFISFGYFFFLGGLSFWLNTNHSTYIQLPGYLHCKRKEDGHIKRWSRQPLPGIPLRYAGWGVYTLPFQ